MNWREKFTNMVGDYIGGVRGGGGEIYVRIVRGGEHEAHLGASGLLIGGDTHSSEPFITGHSGPPISSLIVSGPSLLSTCNCPHPLAFKGWQQTWPRGGGWGVGGVCRWYNSGLFSQANVQCMYTAGEEGPKE